MTDSAISTPPGVIGLQEGYCVSEDFYAAIRIQVESSLPSLSKQRSYTAPQLCGRGFWSQLTDGESRMAGRCIAHMAYRRILPLEFVETKHEYPKRYRLI